MSKDESNIIEKTDSKLINTVLSIDQKKAIRLIIYGFIAAAIFGSLALISRSVSANATNWQTLATQELDMDFWAGKIGYQEYNEGIERISLIGQYMIYQAVILGGVLRFLVNGSLVFTMVGFIGLAMQKDADPSIKKISYALAGVIVLVIMFTSLFTNIAVTIA